MSEFENGNDWVDAYKLYIAVEKLDQATDRHQDCLSVLCSISGAGKWETDDNGRLYYHAPCDPSDRASLAAEGVDPIEVYRPGSKVIPHGVAKCFYVGTVVVCKSAGYLLQGDDIIDRKVHQIRRSESAHSVIEETTLRQILERDGHDDVYWQPLEWRHLQMVVDAHGGQTERFYLLSKILRRKADVQMDAETFIPYGMLFADSDFVDAF